jgi:hypothetical protein
MCTRRVSTVMAVLAALLLAAPAVALAGIGGHDNGYTVRFGGGMAKLYLPGPAKRLQPYNIACGRRGHEETVIGLAAFSAGQRLLSGPSTPPRSHRCIVRQGSHTVAKMHLRKRRHR